MNGPFYDYGWIGEDTGSIFAVITGIAFGFFLERAGLGNVKKLLAQFYLKDLRVFKIMFTAIITTMTGVFLLNWIGFLQADMIYLTPTYIWPQLIGGLIFGVGFIIGGYCPGTSCVALSTGSIDGSLNVAGSLTGILLFGELYPYLEKFYTAGPLGQVTLAQYFGLPAGVMVFLIILMALGGFWLSEKLERKTRREMKSLNHRLALIAIASGGIILLLGVLAPKGWNKTNKSPRFIHVIALAKGVKQRENLYLVDLRDSAQFKEFHLPTALNISPDRFSFSDVPDEKTVVFYSGDDWLSRQLWNSLEDSLKERSFILYGGVYDWYDRILYPKLPIKPNAKDSALAEQVHALTGFYGGYAEFVEDNEIMNYYRIDLSETQWPKPIQQAGLVRKGC